MKATILIALAALACRVTMPAHGQVFVMQPPVVIHQPSTTIAVQVRIPEFRFTLPPVRSRLLDIEVPPAAIKEVDGLIDLYGGIEDFGVVVAPDRVEISKLRKRSDDATSPSDYAEEDTKVVSAEDSTVLSKTFTSDSAFNWNEAYDCVPSFEVRIKFFSGSKVLCVDICTTCYDFRTVFKGREIAHANFGYGYPEIAKVLLHYVSSLKRGI